MENEPSVAGSEKLSSLGTVFLRVSGVPFLSCELLALAEYGFCCRASFGPLNPDEKKRWKNILKPGASLQTAISLSSGPASLPARSLVTDARIAGDIAIVKLTFDRSDTKTRETVNSAMLSSGLHTALATPSAGAISSVDLKGAGAVTPSASGLKRIDAAKLSASGLSRVEAGKSSSASGARVATPKPFATGEFLAASSTARRSGQHAAVPRIWTPTLPAGVDRRKPLGELLVAMGKLTPPQLAKALEARRPRAQKLGRYLLRRNFVKAADLCEALALKHALPMVDLSHTPPNEELTKRLPFLTLIRVGAVPFAVIQNVLHLAARQPLNAAEIKVLAEKTDMKIQVCMASDDQVSAHLHALQPTGFQKFRASSRCEMAVPIYLQISDRMEFDNSSREGRTINISEGGLFVASPENVGPAQLVYVRFNLVGDEIEGLYSARHVAQMRGALSAEFPWLIGLETLEMSEENLRKVKACCLQFTARP